MEFSQDCGTGSSWYALWRLGIPYIRASWPLRRSIINPNPNITPSFTSVHSDCYLPFIVCWSVCVRNSFMHIVSSLFLWWKRIIFIHSGSSLPFIDCLSLCVRNSLVHNCDVPCSCDGKESCQVWGNASLLLRLESISLLGAYSYPTHSNIGNNAPSTSHYTLEI